MSPFDVPMKVAAIMENFDRPWYVAGGWGVDLYLDSVTRSHEDIEIAVLRADQKAIYDHLSDWTLMKVIPGPEPQMEQWNGEWLGLPVHEIHATRTNGDGLDHLEILFSEAFGEQWVFRRNPVVTRPLSRIGVVSKSGIPCIAPELILLYKARDPSEADKFDFANLRNSLDPDGRRWLASALEICYPDHPWRSWL